MNKEKYVASTIKKLKCSNKRKLEIKRELSADIQMAMENGEEWELIRERMETPESLAKEFNENLSEKERKEFKRIKGFKIAGFVLVLIAVLITVVMTLQPKTYPIEYQGKFSEQKVLDQAKLMIELVNNGDYDTIKNQYSDPVMAKKFDENTMNDAKKQIGAKWDQLQSYTSVYTIQLRQAGKIYAVVQITTLYQEKSVEYTISFDQNMKLAGFFMK